MVRSKIPDTPISLFGVLVKALKARRDLGIDLSLSCPVTIYLETVILLVRPFWSCRLSDPDLATGSQPAYLFPIVWSTELFQLRQIGNVSL